AAGSRVAALRRTDQDPPWRYRATARVATVSGSAVPCGSDRPASRHAALARRGGRGEPDCRTGRYRNAMFRARLLAPLAVFAALLVAGAAAAGPAAATPLEDAVSTLESEPIYIQSGAT